MRVARRGQVHRPLEAGPETDLVAGGAVNTRETEASRTMPGIPAWPGCLGVGWWEPQDGVNGMGWIGRRVLGVLQP